MKTKILYAFVTVILAALLSNFIFKWLIIRDFDNYVNGVREDQFYWILASVEGSYSNGQWDRNQLSESIHWAMMMGLNIKILDSSGQEVLASSEVMKSLPDSMKHRMHTFFHVQDTSGNFEEHPVFYKGNRIGVLLSRPFQKEAIREKELAFKQRTRNFLYISFLIAGGGSLIIAWALSRYLTKPLTRLKGAAEKIGRGEFNARIESKSTDEVGKLSETFNLMAESLQKEEELRNHLMSNIAHELKTPLTIMKSHVEAITDKIIDPERGLENVRSEIERLIKLVRGIEDITTAEASFFKKTDEVEVNLKEFLSNIVDEIAPVFKEKRLEIELINENDLPVSTDVEKLELIVRNIISNALKFTEKGGVRISYGADPDTFFVEIRDTGKGIPEQEIPHIFDRFYRVDKSSGTGLGLGLAIVKELLNVMGGRIDVESKVGTGTVFRIYLNSILKQAKVKEDK